jgi:hypothetical protein
MHDSPESSPSGFRNGQRAAPTGGAPVLVKRAIHERIQNITPLKVKSSSLNLDKIFLF